MCRLLKVSKSRFYAWVDRPLSARVREGVGLTALIHTIHRRSKGTYGSPSIYPELADEHSRRVGRKRVARLMRAVGLPRVNPTRFVRTTTSDRPAPSTDLVDRQFVTAGTDKLWATDIF
jgi:putative transposase